jgi:hypothetical protein
MPALVHRQTVERAGVRRARLRLLPACRLPPAATCERASDLLAFILTCCMRFGGLCAALSGVWRRVCGWTQSRTPMICWLKCCTMVCVALLPPYHLRSCMFTCTLCHVTDPAKRISAEDALKHPFFSEAPPYHSKSVCCTRLHAAPARRSS